MATFGDLQNGLLQRCRQTGVNWGGTPTNTATSLLPPYRVKYELNQSYNRALAICKDFPIATLEVSFQTVANTSRFSLNPIPTSNANVASFVQAGDPQTGTIYTLPIAPTNGNVVAIVVASTGSLAAVTVKDSNGVSLTKQAVQADPLSTNSIAIFDYTVSGSPTQNFTISTSVTKYALGYEMDSTTTATYSTGSGNGTTVTLTQAGVTSGALQIGGVISTSNAHSTTLALSNGNNVVDINAQGEYLTHAVATSTASSTATATGPGAVAVFYATYPSAAQTVYNPCAMQIYEYKYTQAGGQIRYIPFVSDARFREYTAGYNQVSSSFSAFPDVLRQTFGQRVVDAFPGYATEEDTITLTICPDPIATSALFSSTQVSCARGNIMSAITDVPLLPAQYHPVILAGAIIQIAPDIDKVQVGADAQKIWDAFVQEMDDFGSTVAEGDAQQSVIDTWSAMISPELSVM